jgi:type III secretory pathway component EscR
VIKAVLIVLGMVVLLDCVIKAVLIALGMVVLTDDD